jgi:putative two-component system response regulator
MEKRRILIVEDDELVGLVCALILEGGGGFLTRIVPCAPCVVNAARDFLPHLILLDMHLADGNGMDLHSELRTHREFDDIAIALMTGSMSQNEAAVSTLSNGLPIIAKPFSPAELLAFATALLGPGQRLSRSAA